MRGESNAIVLSPFQFLSTAAFYFWTKKFLFLFSFSFYHFIIFLDNNIFLILFRSPRPSWKLSSGPTQPLRMQWLLGFQTLRGVKYQWRMSSAKMTTNSHEVMEYVDENAAPFKKLRGGVEFVSAIPTTTDVQALRAELAERQRNGKSRAVLRRRSSVVYNLKEDRKFSLKRFSVSPTTRPGIISPIIEEKPTNVARSQICVLL